MPVSTVCVLMFQKINTETLRWETGPCSVIGRFLPDYMVTYSRGP